MEPKIKTLTNKKLIGISEKMSIQVNKTGKLFSTFMPRRKEVSNAVNANTFALQIYPDHYFQKFSPTKEFTKWALVEVSSFENIPNGMEAFELQGGEYAVFYQKGIDTSIFQYIYSEWIPQSEFQLDDRPHFEILGAKTKLNDPDSEEEIWIPVKKRNS